MAESNMKLCSISTALKERLNKFRFRKEKNFEAIVMKIDKEQQIVIEDTSLDISVADPGKGVLLEELAEELPSREPRYIAYSYAHKHSDGRQVYPLIFIFLTPEGCKPESSMLYTGSVTNLINEGKFTKVVEVRDVDELSNDWLDQELGYKK